MTIPDPLDEWLEKDYTLKPKPTSEPKAPMQVETLTLQIKLDPHSVGINRGQIPNMIVDSLIEYLLEIEWSQAAISRALNISDRTVYNRIQKIKEA